ncbi:MAG: fimbrillin family protein [Tannerella sp.]|jgi:hypothetical protein|nr:fimbrillin family protein [Tannerella sp.]
MNKMIFKGAMLLAAVAATSCQSENEPIPVTTTTGNAISFRIQGSKPSTYTLPTVRDDIDGFVVNGWVDDAGTLTRVIFDRKSVVRDALTGNFVYAPTVYYPAEATTAGFTAFSPINAVHVSGSEYTITDQPVPNPIVATDNVIAYTVPDPGSDPKGVAQKDLLVAYTPLPSLTSTVALTFKHALSRILVSVKNKTAEPLIITKLCLVNVATGGTLDLDANTWTGYGSDVEDLNDDYFSPPSSATEYKVLWQAGAQTDSMHWLIPESGVAVPVNDDYHSIVSEEQAMLVLPQITKLTNGDPANFADATDFHLLIGYQLSNLKSEDRIAFADLNGFKVSDKGLAFEMGKQYNLRLEFTAGGGSGGGGANTGISFTVVVDDWEDPSTAEGTIQ